MNKAVKKFTNAKIRSRTVCRIPELFLKIKGRIDSRKGEGACDEYLRKLKKKEAAHEAAETMCAENALTETRKAGAAAVVKYSSKSLPAMPLQNYAGESRPAPVRIPRSAEALKNTKRAASIAALGELTQINETIIYIDTLLDEHIEKIRNHIAEKCHAYIAGVRAGKLPDYEFPVNDYSDNASIIYHNRHHELDSAIRQIVSDSMKEAIA